MKELKVYVPQDWPYGLAPEEGGEPVEEDTCYLKSDVDAAIDELKAAHHKERHEYIEMVAQLRRENEELKGQVNGFKNRANLWHYNALNEHNAAVAVRMENAKLKAKLAEKDKEIAELKADYKEACDRLQTANLIKDEQIAATRHQKYKRCLANANYWVAISYHCIDDKRRQRAERHHRKWLELANKFKDKEAK